MKLSAVFTFAIMVSATGAAWAQSHDMKGMGSQDKGAQAQGGLHHASGTVKKLDPDKGTVTFAHGPVKSLSWPAMTMGFVVKDKKIFDRLAADKKVEFEFKQEGSDYVVTSVR